MVLVGLAACGDAATKDGRGYTKAPLERPGPVIQPEPTTAMDELGDPILPPIVDITLGETGSTTAPAAPQS